MTANPKAPEGAIAIPEDLRKQYASLSSYQPMKVAVTSIYVREYMVLIERIAALTQRAELAESRVKALDWQRITPENLPKVGDELYSDMSQLVMRFHKDYTSMFTFTPWTHFRPISAPVEEKENKHV